MIAPHLTGSAIPKDRFVVNGPARPYAFLEDVYPTLPTHSFDALLGIIDEAEQARRPQ